MLLTQMWNEEAREARGLRRMSVTVSSPADERKGRDWFHTGLSRCQGHDAKALSSLRIILRKEVISNTIGLERIHYEHYHCSHG